MAVAFMRPVSSLTHALDHWLWPRSPFGMHLQSLAWFACMLLVAARAYRELSEDRRVVGLASAMFAIDSAHGAPVGWISDRNALLGGVFGTAALLFHHRHRHGRGRLNAVLAASCFALGLLSTEAAIGSAGYLAAYASCFERARLRTRLASLLPYAAISALWLAVRRAAHYGVVGLGGYLDPIKNPLAFIRVLPERSAVLLASQVAGLCSDLFDAVPLILQPLHLFLAAACCSVVAWVGLPALRAHRDARFWAVGAGLSALPLAAATPTDCVLTLVGLGVMPSLARVMLDALRPGPPASRSAAWAVTLRRDVAIGLAVIHLGLEPLMLPLVALLPSMLASSTLSLEASLPNSPTLRQQTVIVAAIPDSWMLSYLPVIRAVRGKPRPDKVYWLLASQQDARFERLGSNHLRVSSEQGFFDAHWPERNSLQPLHRGERVQLSEMTVTVLEVTPDGRPLVCDFVFSQPLESTSYLWVTWRNGRLEPFQLPRG